jgi:hypothetical protein
MARKGKGQTGHAGQQGKLDIGERCRIEIPRLEGPSVAKAPKQYPSFYGAAASA